MRDIDNTRLTTENESLHKKLNDIYGKIEQANLTQSKAHIGMGSRGVKNLKECIAKLYMMSFEQQVK